VTNAPKKALGLVAAFAAGLTLAVGGCGDYDDNGGGTTVTITTTNDTTTEGTTTEGTTTNGTTTDDDSTTGETETDDDDSSGSG
jgi:hypothetical protein